METARLFRNGRSQAVRLPKRFAFTGNEVYVTGINGIVMLVPKGNGPWKAFRESLELFTDDFLAGGREQGRVQRRESVG